MYRLKIQIKFDTKDQAKNFFASIKPELTEFRRSETKISLRDCVLGVEIDAADKAATRASLNAITKPLKLFKNLGELK